MIFEKLHNALSNFSVDTGVHISEVKIDPKSFSRLVTELGGLRRRGDDDETAPYIAPRYVEMATYSGDLRIYPEEE